MQDPLVHLSEPLRALSIKSPVAAPSDPVILDVNPDDTHGLNGSSVASTEASSFPAEFFPSQPEPEAVVRPSAFEWPSNKVLESKLALPLGFLLTPATALAEGSPTLRRTCIRCIQCNGAVNPYTTVKLGVGAWSCMFCGQANSHAAEFSDTNTESYPELASKVVEYVEPFAQPSAPLIGSSSSASFVLVLDENMTRNDAASLRTSVNHLLSGLPRGSVMTLITFSNTVSIYNLATKDTIAATVFPSSKHLSDSTRTWINSNLVSIAVPLVYGSESLSIALGVFTNIRNRSRAVKGQPSALGVALEFAEAILRTQYPDVSGLPRRKELDHRIIVVSSTAPHLGPSPQVSSTAQSEHLHSTVASFYRRVATQLLTIGATIDVFCVGHAQLGLKVLSQLTQPCAGRIFTYSDCGDQLTADLIFAIWENRWLDCTLALRFPPSVTLTRVIGPALQLASSGKLASYQAPWNIDLSKERGSQFRIASFGPRDCLAAYMELAETSESVGLVEAIPSPTLITIQAEMQYTNRLNERVLRVVTFQLRVSSDIPTILAAVDGDVTAVLLARTAVLQAKTTSGSEQAQAALDIPVAAILRSVGQPQPSLPYYKLPLSLQELPLRMYHLRRGPLLGSLLQHPDDIALAQAQFLSMPLEASLRRLTPTLLTFFVDPQDFQTHALQLPLVNLVLRSNRVLLLDDESTVLVWLGALTGTPQYESIRSYALNYASALAQMRFPRPTIRALEEGSSMARFLLCRLSPLHKEDRAAQEAQLPEISTLSPAEFQRLVAQFHRTDEQSFGEYCRVLRLRDPRR